MKTISRQNVSHSHKAIPASAKFIAVAVDNVARIEAGENIMVANSFRSLASAQKDQRWTKNNCAPSAHYEIYEIV